MAQRLFTFLVACTLSSSGHAGIETELFSAQYGECTARVIHDAVPYSQTATIVFKSYRVADGVHHPCALSGQDARDSLDRALAGYLMKAELKQVTSIFIGRLIHYPWVVKTLEEGAGSGKRGHLSHKEFNKLVFGSETIRPFKQAVEEHGYAVTSISCEKLMFYRNGAPRDAMCWLIVNKQPKTD